MNKAQLKRDFLPKEVVLKLHKEIERSDYVSRVRLVKDYAESVKDTYDPEVFEIKLNKVLGFLYWEANQYDLAIYHYEKVVEFLDPEDYPWIYLHTVEMLSRCNRLIFKYKTALKWVTTSFKHIHLSDSSFDSLKLLREYANLLSETNELFDKNYLQFIESVIKDLEFPEPPSNSPIEKSRFLSALNLKWNKELSRITILQTNNKEVILSEFEEYERKCEQRAAFTFSLTRPLFHCRHGSYGLASLH